MCWLLRSRCEAKKKKDQGSTTLLGIRQHDDQPANQVPVAIAPHPPAPRCHPPTHGSMTHTPEGEIQGVLPRGFRVIDIFREITMGKIYGSTSLTASSRVVRPIVSRVMISRRSWILQQTPFEIRLVETLHTSWHEQLVEHWNFQDQQLLFLLVSFVRSELTSENSPPSLTPPFITPRSNQMIFQSWPGSNIAQTVANEMEAK